MNKTTLFNALLSAILILCIGLFTGYTLGYKEAQGNSFKEINPVSEVNPGIATIKFLKQEKGKLYGQVSGQEARIAYSLDHIKEVKVGESFEIPLKDTNLAAFYGAEEIPEGMTYISSKSGAYFYHILDPRSLRITPKNRVYFQTEEQALEAGYQPAE